MQLETVRTDFRTGCRAHSSTWSLFGHVSGVVVGTGWLPVLNQVSHTAVAGCSRSETRSREALFGTSVTAFIHIRRAYRLVTFDGYLLSSNVRAMYIG